MKHQVTVHDIEARNVYAATGLKIDANPSKRTPWEKTLANTWGAGTRGEWSIDRGCCKGCACDFDSSPVAFALFGTTVELRGTVCDDCWDQVRRHYNGDEQAADEDATATPKWDANCPARHKQVAFGEVRPAGVDWPAFERVVAWRPDAPENQGRGIICTGQWGTGKTSAFWTLARELERCGHAPITLGSLELNRVLSEAAKDIREVGWLYRCRVLMVDDLGKERATPGAAALLWEVLDRRLAANLPLICTTNFAGDEFSARFGEPHLGDAIRRRIRELCRQVIFRTDDEREHAAAASSNSQINEKKSE